MRLLSPIMGDLFISKRRQVLFQGGYFCEIFLKIIIYVTLKIWVVFEPICSLIIFFADVWRLHTHTHPNSSDLQGCLRFQICRCIFFVPPPLQNRNQVQSHLEFGLVSLVLLSNPPSTWVGSSQDGA